MASIPITSELIKLVQDYMGGNLDTRGQLSQMIPEGYLLSPVTGKLVPWSPGSPLDFNNPDLGSLPEGRSWGEGTIDPLARLVNPGVTGLPNSNFLSSFMKPIENVADITTLGQGDTDLADLFPTIFNPDVHEAAILAGAGQTIGNLAAGGAPPSFTSPTAPTTPGLLEAGGFTPTVDPIEPFLTTGAPTSAEFPWLSNAPEGSVLGAAPALGAGGTLGTLGALGTIGAPIGAPDSPIPTGTPVPTNTPPPGGFDLLGSLGSNPALWGAGLGALLASNGGGSNPSGTITTTEDIPEWLKLYANVGLGGLTDAYSQSPGGISPVTQAGGGYLQDTIGGNYLNSNPYLDSMYDKAAGKVSAGVNSLFSKGGRFGSGAHQGVLGDTLSGLATDIYGGNYAAERTNQQNAALSSGTFGNFMIDQPFRPGQNLLTGVGSIRGSTKTEPYFQNKNADLLSGILGGSLLGKTIFG